MNIVLLKWLHNAISDRTSSSSVNPLRTQDEKLDFILYALSELMVALATDGTQESINRFYQRDGGA